MKNYTSKYADNYAGKIEYYQAQLSNAKKNGISDWHIRHMEKQELVELKETFQFMMKHYIDLEQYEKCGVLKSELDKVESILERVI